MVWIFPGWGCYGQRKGGLITSFAHRGNRTLARVCGGFGPVKQRGIRPGRRVRYSFSEPAASRGVLPLAMASNAITQPDELSPPPAPGREETVDEALVGLPAPPRVRTRVLGGLLVAISAACLFLGYQ